MSQFTPTLTVSSVLFPAGLETQRNLFLTIEHNLSLNQLFFKKGETSCTENYRKTPLMPVEALDIHINNLWSFSACSMYFLQAWDKDAYRPECC